MDLHNIQQEWNGINIGNFWNRKPMLKKVLINRADL